MRMRHGTTEEKCKLEMTPMIDLVFQLLIFFVMTFKINPSEGDFNIKMPTPGRAAVSESTQLTMKLRLLSNGQGELREIVLNDNLSFGTDWNALRAKMVELVGDPAERTDDEGPEIEIDLDYDLHYAHVVQAITSATGYRTGNDIVPLIRRIKFAPVRK